MWERRGRRFGLTGNQAYRWARLSERERDRYAGYGRRHGLAWYEVYREPLLVTAARRHPSPLSHPWRYRWQTLWRRRDDLARVAATGAGLEITRGQRPPVAGNGLEVGRYWMFTDPDLSPLTSDDGPWHPSLTFRGPETGPDGYGDVANWVEGSGIDWVVLSYSPDRGPFVWVMWFPFTSPSGGGRH